MQPHPEFDDSFIGGMLETKGKAVPAALVEHAETRLDDGKSSAELAGRIAEFFLKPRS